MVMQRKYLAAMLAVCVVAIAAVARPAFAEDQAVGPYTDFKGTINLDVRDSKADWGPFTPKKPPAGAPNILFILYDDTGLSAWSPYGGRINMPTLQRLADAGLMYTQWHTVVKQR
jgi:arylsulfatase